jgi:hypothetical protein|tara:strand:+ start:274 stop:690 length:417 start_codon:yes stop_codon:yes gene_type:complete
MNNIIVKQSQLVTATIDGTPTVNRRYKFNDIPNLSRNNIILYGIEAYSASQLSNTASGADVISAADTLGVTVTLKDNQNNEFIYQMPYTNLIRSNNGGFVILLEPKVINLTDCYVQINNVLALADGDQAVFNFYYDFV